PRPLPVEVTHPADEAAVGPDDRERQTEPRDDDEDGDCEMAGRKPAGTSPLGPRAMVHRRRDQNRMRDHYVEGSERPQPVHVREPPRLAEANLGTCRLASARVHMWLIGMRLHGL